MDKSETIELNLYEKIKASIKIEVVETYFLFFLMYGVLGWLYEVFLEVIVYQWGFSNRGFLFGPYLPVYGFGALTFILCLRRLKEKELKFRKVNLTPVFVFLSVVMITTLMELVTSYIMEWIAGGWLWDYHAYSWNFQGRIALNPSMRFGIGGTVFIYLIQPFFEQITGRLHASVKHKCFMFTFFIFMIDTVLTVFWI